MSGECYLRCEAVVEAGFVPETIGTVDHETYMVMVRPEFVDSVCEFLDRLSPRRPPLMERS